MSPFLVSRLLSRPRTSATYFSDLVRWVQKDDRVDQLLVCQPLQLVVSGWFTVEVAGPPTSSRLEYCCAFTLNGFRMIPKWKMAVLLFPISKELMTK